MTPAPAPRSDRSGRSDRLRLGGKAWRSRLIIGSGGYRSPTEQRACAKAAGAQLVTAAVRRVPLGKTQSAAALAPLPQSRAYTLLPNSAGCRTAEEAVRVLRLARAALGVRLVKLEVCGEDAMLYPDMEETLKAAAILVGEGFHVMAYCSDDIVGAHKLDALGCAAIMPLAAPIGSGLGVQNPFALRLLVERCRAPVLVDAGLGSPADAAEVMALGCAGVLVNTAIAKARAPVQMAQAMKLAVEAGRLGFLAGRMTPQDKARASSPAAGKITAS